MRSVAVIWKGQPSQRFVIVASHATVLVPGVVNVVPDTWPNAVTAVPIPLEELKYWSVERQEAYASCEIATRRLLGLDPA